MNSHISMSVSGSNLPGAQKILAFSKNTDDRMNMRNGMPRRKIRLRAPMKTK